MKQSIEYGVRKPSSDFDRRPSTPHSVSYVGKSETSKSGKPTYANGNMSKNSKSSANFAKQSKSQGMTGSGLGRGGNKFGSPKGSVSSFGKPSMSGKGK